MQMNQAMQQLFQQHSLDLHASFPDNIAHPIWMKTTTDGRPYWGTGSFFGLDQRPVQPDANLSCLEWDGNEVYLSGETMEDTASLLPQMMGILTFWKREVAEKYPDSAFYLIASYDDGQSLVDDEEDQPIPSVTLRFWADRGDETVAEVKDLERYAQPVILVYCMAGTGNGPY